MTVLVVDMNWKEASLSRYEFVLPILSVVEPLEPCTVKHYLDVNPIEVENYSHIILSGTTLKDFEFLDHLECFQWIKTCSKPILGHLRWHANHHPHLWRRISALPTGRHDRNHHNQTQPALQRHIPSLQPPHLQHSARQPNIRRNSTIQQMHPSHSTQTETHSTASYSTQKYATPTS